MPEVASLTGRVAIEGVGTVQSDLRGLGGAFTQVGGGAKTLGDEFLKAAMNARGMGGEFQKAEAGTDGLAESLERARDAALKQAQATTLSESESARLAVRISGLSQAIAAQRAAWELEAASGKASAESLALRSTIIGELEGKLSTYTAQLQGNVTQTEDLSGASNALSSALSRLPGPLGAISSQMVEAIGAGQSLALVFGGVLGTAALAAGAALVSVTNETIDYSVAVIDLADRLSVSTQFVAKFVEAADDASVASRGVGVDIGTVASALERFEMMSGRAGLAADGMGSMTAGAARAFERLGISLEDSAGNARNAEDLLLDVADALSQVGSNAERVALAKRLGLYELLPLLQQGRSGVEEMMGAINDARVTTDQNKESVLALKKAQDDLDDSLKAIRLTIGGAVVPVMNTFIGQLALATQRASDMGNVMLVINSILSGNMGQIAGLAYAQSVLNREAERTKNAWRDAYADAPRYIEATGRALANLPDPAADRERSVNAVLAASAWNQGQRDIEAATDATNKKLDAQKKLIDDLRGAWGKGYKPPSGEEKAGTIAGLSMGTIDVQQFEKTKLIEQATSLYTSKLITGEDVASLARVFDKYGLNSTEMAQQLAKVSPAARQKLAGMVQEVGGIEKEAGVRGGFAQLSDSVTSSTSKVQPSKEAVLDAKLAKMDLDEANKHKTQAPLEGQMLVNDYKLWNKDQADRNNLEAEKGAMTAQKHWEEANRLAQGYFVTVYDFQKKALTADDAVARHALDRVSTGESETPNILQGGQVQDEQVRAVKDVANVITSQAPVITDAISQLMQDAVGAWKDKGAATVWTGVSEFIMQTLADGIRANGPLVRSAMQDAVQANANWLKQQIYAWVYQMLRG